MVHFDKQMIWLFGVSPIDTVAEKAVSVVDFDSPQRVHSTSLMSCVQQMLVCCLVVSCVVGHFSSCWTFVLSVCIMVMPKPSRFKHLSVDIFFKVFSYWYLCVVLTFIFLMRNIFSRACWPLVYLMKCLVGRFLLFVIFSETQNFRFQ